MGLRFGCARANRRPADEVAQILRGDRVERFGGAGQPGVGDVEQKLPRPAHAFFDVEGVIHARVVDEAFPAGGGARLFEIDAHHQQHGFIHLIGQPLQAQGVFDAGDRVVNRARADHHKQARVFVVEDGANRAAAFEHSLASGIRQRQARGDFARRGHGVEGGDV